MKENILLYSHSHLQQLKHNLQSSSGNNAHSISFQELFDGFRWLAEVQVQQLRAHIWTFFWWTALILIILRASVNPKVDRISQVITTSTVLLLYVIFQGFYDGLLWTTILKNCVLIHFEDTINVAPVVFPLDKILVCYGATCLTRIWAEVYMYFSQNFEMFCFLGGGLEELLCLSKMPHCTNHVLH